MQEQKRKWCQNIVLANTICFTSGDHVCDNKISVSLSINSKQISIIIIMLVLQQISSFLWEPAQQNDQCK